MIIQVFHGYHACNWDFAFIQQDDSAPAALKAYHAFALILELFLCHVYAFVSEVVHWIKCYRGSLHFLNETFGRISYLTTWVSYSLSHFTVGNTYSVRDRTDQWMWSLLRFSRLPNREWGGQKEWGSGGGGWDVLIYYLIKTMLLM